MNKETEKELIKAFHNNLTEKPELASNIWLKIIKRYKYKNYAKASLFLFFGVASLGGLVPVVKMLSADLAQSGFYEYLSLAFSNTGSVFSYWKEFSLSLAESLPTTSLTLSLSLIFVLFLSFKFAMKQIINNKYIGISYV